MNKRGSVLIMVLWSLFLLAMLAVAVQSYVMPQVALSVKLLGRAKMRSIANAGVERAILEIENDDTELYDGLQDSWSAHAEAFDHVSVGGGFFSVVKEKPSPSAPQEYGLTDEEGRINLNKASRDVLKNLFEKVAGVESEDADALADSIIDWRDADDFKQKNGKENDYYQSLEHPYDCKNSDFEIVDELLLVGGMTPEIFDKIKQHVTVYGDGQVNINTAGVPVLMSLGMDEPLAEKVVRFRTGSGVTKGGDFASCFFSDSGMIADVLSKGESLSGDEVAQIQRVTPLLGVRSDHFRGRVLGEYLAGGKPEMVIFVYDRKERILNFWRET